MNFLRDVILTSGGEDGDGDKRLHRARTAYTYVMLALLGVGLSLVSLFLASPYGEASGNAMFISYFRIPLLVLLNTLPCILLVLLFYFITGRAWVSFAVSSLFIVGASLGNYYKIRLRTDPFIASDISVLGEAGNIAGKYSLELTGRVIFSLFCVLAGLLFAVFLIKGRCGRARSRIICAILTVFVGAGLYMTVYKSETVYDMTANERDINKWNTNQVFVSKGFVYPFIYSIQDAVPNPPEGYSTSAAEGILSRYETDDIPSDKKVNIISVMLEAYADLSEWDALNFEEDVYAGLHELQKESVSGTLISNVFGGGTIDTERCFLTGYTLSGDYRKHVNSYVWYLRSQGYRAEGVHTGDGWFYNRKNVNEYLGFEDYYFLETMPGSDRSDSFFFKKVGELYENRDKNVPYFSYNLTYQNHGAYDSEKTCEKHYISPDGISTESFNILNNYLSGICDTSNRMLEFVDGFRDDTEPVVIIFYGDHKPWLGNAMSVYNELGINVDVGTEEGFHNYFSTPYVIWANDAAKEMLGNDFEGEGETISACFLMNEIFRLCSWEGNDFMKLNSALRAVTPIVNSKTGLFRYNGELTSYLHDNDGELWRDYKLAQYYLSHNFLY